MDLEGEMKKVRIKVKRKSKDDKEGKHILTKHARFAQ
jgi:hypothetical protein